MATAVARVASVYPDGTAQQQLITLEVGYLGLDSEIGGGADVQPVVVVANPADSPQTLKVKMTQAVLADAQTRNYTLAAANLTLPVFQKGTP